MLSGLFSKRNEHSNSPTQTSRGSSDENVAKPIEIDAEEDIHSVVFLTDGKYLIGRGGEGTLRRWKVDDGKEVGKPLAVKGSYILCFAVSQDGKWIVTGSQDGFVTSWNATNHKKVLAMEHNSSHRRVNAVDVTPDGSRIAGGGDDGFVHVWSNISTAVKYELQPVPRLSLQHENKPVAGVKFSSDGELIATAAWNHALVRIHNRHNVLVAKFPIAVSASYNRSLVWASDGRRLFVSSRKHVHCLDVPGKTTLWKLSHDCKLPCVSLASNDTILALADDTSVSLWDTDTLQNIGPAVECNHPVRSLTITPYLDIATGGGNTITLQNLHDILPSRYCDNALGRRTRRSQKGMTDSQKKIQLLLAQDAHSNSKIASLEKSLQDLRNELSTSQLEASKKENSLNRVIQWLRTLSNDKIADLEKRVQQLLNELTISQCKADEQKDGMDETIRSLQADLHTRETHSRILETTVQELRNNHHTQQTNTAGLQRTITDLHAQLSTAQHSATQMEHDLIRIIQCDQLYMRGNIYDVTESLSEVTNAVTDDLRVHKSVIDWRAQITEQCMSRLQIMGDEASSTNNHDEALKAYSTALSLTPSAPNTLLVRWTREMLCHRSPDEVSNAATAFPLLRFCVHRAICDVLEDDNRVTEAIEFFRRKQGDLGNAESDTEVVQWESDFRQRCIEKLKNLGDKVMESKNYDGAIEYYSIALSLKPTKPCNIIVKCCEARAGLWEDGYVDAAKVIETDPSSYKGFKQKYTVLHHMGRYGEAFEAFERMLSVIENSADPEIRKFRSRYINITPLIRKTIDETISDIPRILMDVDSGHLFDRSLQAAAFESLPVYDELRSSMTTRDQLDYARIRNEVEKFYEYVMFSHKWEPPQEPTLQMLENKSIDDLPPSRGNNKLRGFREIVRSHRFRWCWSDTCCVNQADKGVQQESVVAMFRWYRRSAVTVIHLLGVFSDSGDEDLLWKSIWNTRGWTYQEYVASPVVQFYTEDWKPYRGLTMWNHKDSPIIRAEMERVTKVATQELAMLKPGLERVREKLYLASRRETTRGEDVAYCLFGIFGISISVIYGEGKEAAVHRLLQHILTHSDNVTLLSWTGDSCSETNSYLPPDLTVYDQIAPPHVPPPIGAEKMNRMIMALQSSSPDVPLSVQLYNRLCDHPPLSLVAGRLRLPSFVFFVTDISSISDPDSDSSLLIYRARTAILGDVEIKTKNDLSGMTDLILVHPWITPLLDEDFSKATPLFDLNTRALRLVVRLQQPFGALLLAPLGRVQYTRVATDSLIQVQIRTETSVKALMDSIRTVDLQ